MSLKKSLGVVSLATLVFALLGVVIGAALGQWAPSYYRGMFSAGSRPDFDPLQMGIGLGLTQGLAAGIVVGFLVVAFMLWNDKSPAEDHLKGKPTQQRNSRWVFRAMFGIALSVVFVISVVAAFILGAVFGSHQQNVATGDESMHVLVPILQDARFSYVTGEPSSAGRLYLSGHVADPQTRDELLKELQHAFGDATATSMIEGVTVGE